MGGRSLGGWELGRSRFKGPWGWPRRTAAMVWLYTRLACQVRVITEGVGKLTPGQCWLGPESSLGYGTVTFAETRVL